MQQRAEDGRVLGEIKSSHMISRRYTDRERWFKWIVGLKGPGVPKKITLQLCLSEIVLTGLTGVPRTSNEGASIPWTAAVDGMKAGPQH